MINIPFSFKEFVRKLNIFKRNKKKFETKVSAIKQKISKSSVHDYVKAFREKLKEFFLNIKPEKHKVIAIDETCLKANGRKIYVYSAVDAESREIIYIKEVMEKCSAKPKLVLIDKAPWLINAVKRFSLKYKCETFGERNCVERVFGYLKDRSKIFYHNINVNFKKILKRMERNLRSKRALECMNEFLVMFAFYYNTLR